MNVYNHRKVTEYWLTRIKGEHAEYADTIYAFIQALRLYGIGEAKVKDYAQFSLRIIEIYKDRGRGDDTKSSKNSNNNNYRPIDKWDKEDIDRIANIIISNKKWSYATIAIALRVLKRLVHYAKHKEIADGKSIKYCYEVEHIHPDRYKRKAMKEETVKSSDLLTKEEFLRMIDKVAKVSRYPKRDRALLYVMYEYASRPSELLNMRIKGVRFYDNYCEITTEGKTGVKTLALVLSYKPLLEWMEEHPDKENPEAYLWYSKPKGVISYGRLRRFIKELAKEAGIKKRVWLYLIRHTALTAVEKEFGSNITEIYGNWRRGSPIRNRYIHLANSDQREAILRRYGIKNNDDNNNNNNVSIVTFRECNRCNTKNDPNARICKLCGLILDREYALRIKDEKEARIKELESKIERLEGIINALAERLK